MWQEMNESSGDVAGWLKALEVWRRYFPIRMCIEKRSRCTGLGQQQRAG